MDISKTKINVTCPVCNQVIPIKLQQFANQETIACLNGHQIQLADNDEKIKNTITSVNQILSDIKWSFNSRAMFPNFLAIDENLELNEYLAQITKVIKDDLSKRAELNDDYELLSKIKHLENFHMGIKQINDPKI